MQGKPAFLGASARLGNEGDPVQSAVGAAMQAVHPGVQGSALERETLLHHVLQQGSLGCPQQHMMPAGFR